MPVKCRDCRWVQQIGPPDVYPDIPTRWRCGYFDRKRKVPYWAFGGFYVAPDAEDFCAAFRPQVSKRTT